MDLLYGHIPKDISSEWSGKADRDSRRVQEKFDAMPEPVKKELLDLLFEETERIIRNVGENMKYTEPLRVIGLGDYKI